MRHFNSFFCAISVFVLFPVLSHGAGFEKSVLWSGHYGGVAGAATADVRGSESLFFNPAGLSSFHRFARSGEESEKERSFDLSANYSPTWTKYKGPVIAPSQELESEGALIPPFGVLGSYKSPAGWGFGLGVYAVGGGKAAFKNLDFSDLFATFDTLKPEVSQDIQIIEFSVGAAYKINSDWSVGASWRNTFVKADLSIAQTSGAGLSTLLLGLNFNDMSASEASGFRLGLQYAPVLSDWAFGLTFRSAVSFAAKGTSSGQFESVDGTVDATDITGGDVTLSSTLPVQVSFGAVWEADKEWKYFGEYNWTQYSKNKTLGISGNVNIATTTVPLTGLPLGWFDMHNIRLGAEYKGVEEIIFRGGYVITGQVVPKAYALPLSSSPGLAHTLVFGAGLPLMENDMSVDVALDYSFSSGEVSNQQTMTGTYSTSAFGIHTSLAYRF